MTRSVLSRSPMAMTATAAGQWINAVPDLPRPAARVFCFPHAGGSYVAFSGWREQLPPRLEVVSFCYPGRLRLIREQPFVDLPSLVSELHTAVAGMLDAPFLLLGHSLGALVAFELARALRRAGEPSPAALIVSGRAAAHVPRRRPDLHHLPAAQLLSQLRQLEGLPPGLEQSEEMISLVLPSIRADLQINETYAYDDQPPLDIPMLAMAGWSDPQVNPEDVEAWREQTRGSFSFSTLPGGHFFLVSERDTVLSQIRQKMQDWQFAA